MAPRDPELVSADGGRAGAGGVFGRMAGPFACGVRRYEMVAVTLAAVVLLVWVTGGTLIASGLRSTVGGPPAGPPVVVAPDPGAPVGPPASPGGPIGVMPGPGVPVGPAPDEGESASPGPRPSSPGFADGGRFGSVVAVARMPAAEVPSGLAVGAAGDVWVSTVAAGAGSNAARVLHLGADGGLIRAYAVPGVKALRGAALGPDGRVYFLSAGPEQVLSLDPGSGRVVRVALVPDVPPCIPAVLESSCDGSLVDRVPVLTGLAFDRVGALLVTDAGQGAIWRVPAGGGLASQWLVERTWVSPVHASGPTGLAFDGVGNVVVVVQGTVDSDAGRVYLHAVTATGGPGSRTELASTEAGSLPAGVVLGATGRMYVPLQGVGRVVVLARDGKQLSTAPPASVAGLAAPGPIVFRGSSVLVGCAGAQSGAPGVVVRMPVGDRGMTLLGGL